jgi:hypothetical protein
MVEVPGFEPGCPPGEVLQKLAFRPLFCPKLSQGSGLVYFPIDASVPLQVPNAGELLNIYPVLAPGRCGLVGEERIKADKRNFRSRYVYKYAIISAPFERDPINFGEDLDLYRFTPDLNHHVPLEKILCLQIERGKAKRLEDPHESIRVLVTDSDEYSSSPV